MSSMTRKLKRNKKQNMNNDVDIKFTPKYMTKKEVEYCKGLIFDSKTNQLHHKEGKIYGKWAMIFFPSDFAKEVWAIIYKTTPEKLS